MAKHVWLTRPTEASARRLWNAFYEAYTLGYKDPNTSAPPVKAPSIRAARVFAGYTLERDRQGTSRPAGLRLEATIRGGWRVLQGVNAHRYEQAFIRHLPLITEYWACQTLSYAGETPSPGTPGTDAPWQVVRDWLLDVAYEPEANALAAAWDGISELHLEVAMLDDHEAKHRLYDLREAIERAEHTHIRGVVIDPEVRIEHAALEYRVHGALIHPQASVT